MEDLYYSCVRHLDDVAEAVSVSFSDTYPSAKDLADSGHSLFKNLESDALIERKGFEYHYYNNIENSLLHYLQELKSYSTVNIMNTRRLIFNSSDCISTVHVMVRDAIHLNVYFRSSDIYNALPADLEFLSTIPLKLIQHLKRFKGVDNYEEVNDELIDVLRNKNIQVNLSFGSLHKTGEL